MKHILLEQVT